MPITFAEPRWLLLLLAIPLVWWIGRRSLSGLDTVRRRLSIGLRAALLAALALAAAELEWKDELDRLELVFLLDRSRSIPEPLKKKELDLVNAAMQKIDPRKDRAKIIAFGKNALPEATLEKEVPTTDIRSDLDDNQTDIENALKVTLDNFDPGFRRRVLLMSDGNETTGDAKAGVARVRAGRARVDVVPLDYEYNDEVLVEKLIVPTEAKIGEPFRVRAVVRASKATKAKVTLLQDNGIVETKPVELEPGSNVVEFAHILKKPGFFSLQANVDVDDPKDDQLSQNNKAYGYVYAKGETSILYIHRDERPEDAISKPFLDALTVEKVKVTVGPPRLIPHEPAKLQQYDAIILDDVPREQVSMLQEQAVEQAVHDQALGLIMIGGEHSFGAGDWGSDPPSPIAQALPVEMEIKQQEIIPNGALVIVQHSCEFADGNRWAIQVTQACIDALSAKDMVGLMQFGMTGTDWVFKLQKAENKGRLRQLAGQMQPMDMPDFNAVFEKAYAALKDAPAAVKHMILLSDGDPAAPDPSLVKALREAKVTLSTVTVFPHDGPNGGSFALMKRLANELNGKAYYIGSEDDSKKLPKIFLKETQRVARSLIVDKTFVPRRAEMSEVLRGIDRLPPLHGCVLTEPKTLATIPLRGPENAPVLAHWFYGAGKSLAFTSDATSRWAADWVRWPGFNNYWAQAVRWVSKDVSDSPFQTTVKVEGDRAKIKLDAVTDEGDFVDGLQVKAAVKSPQDKRDEVNLKQVGPGRYEGEFPVKEVGTYTVSLLTTDKQGRRKAAITTGVVAPPSLEFQKLKTDRALLADLARAGEGKLIEPDEIMKGKRDLFARDRREVDVTLVPKWPTILALAVLLLMLDVAIRRVAIDYDKVWAKVSAPFRRSKTAARPVETMSRLMAKKQEVREETLAKFEAPIEPIGSTSSTSSGVTIAGAEDKKPPSQGPGAFGPTTPQPTPTKKPDSPIMTNRLLEAKRRAQQEIKDKIEGEGKT